MLVFLLLLLLCPLAYYFFLLALDNTGTFHSSAKVADLDGDGNLDVLVHNVRKEAEFMAFGGATPWFNQGGGEFIARPFAQGPDGGGLESAAGDVDGDGDADLLLFMGHHLRLLLNQGGDQEGQVGEFKNSHQIIRGPERNGQYGSLILGDLNHDGQMDGVVVGCCGRPFAINPDDSPNVSGAWINEWRNEGRPGQMSVLPALEGLAMRGAALGDLDSDGDLDLFAAVIAPPEGRNRNPADRVIFNDGAGNFSDSGQRLGETDSTAVALGDLDGDGDLDALTGSEKGASLWANQGGAQGGKEGTFALLEQAMSADQTRAVFLADLDALLGGRRLATIWWNDGQAKFVRDRQKFRYSKRHGLAIADFNGDGRLDIFAAAYDDDYRVWFNQGDGIFQNTSRL